MEQGKEKNNAVDAGGNGKRQEVMEHFPEKGNGDDDAELNQVFHGRLPGNTAEM